MSEEDKKKFLESIDNMSEEKANKVMKVIEEDIEFWSSSTKDSFKGSAKDLIDHGYTVEDAAELLSNLYYSCGNEYGC